MSWAKRSVSRHLAFKVHILERQVAGSYIDAFRRLEVTENAPGLFTFESERCGRRPPEDGWVRKIGRGDAYPFDPALSRMRMRPCLLHGQCGQGMSRSGERLHISRLVQVPTWSNKPERELFLGAYGLADPRGVSHLLRVTPTRAKAPQTAWGG